MTAIFIEEESSKIIMIQTYTKPDKQNQSKIYGNINDLKLGADRLTTIQLTNCSFKHVKHVNAKHATKA
jgi:hypothetical protein